MRVKVGVLVSEIVLPLPKKKNFGSFAAGFGSDSFVDVFVEVTLFGQTKRTRNYRVLSSTSPILPCEQLYFSQEFIGCRTIADLLRSFEREQFSLRLFSDHQNVSAHSSLRHELLAEYDDNAFNVLYPYHTLHPSYDHVSRRLHLNSLTFESRPILARLTLSVAISGNDEPKITSRSLTTPSADRRSSPSKLKSHRLAPKPAYMDPTFSTMMSAHTTRQKFFSTPSIDRTRTGDQQRSVERIPRSRSDFLRGEY